MNGSADMPSVTAGSGGLAERLDRLEAQIAALTEAVEVLVRGLESSPMAEPANGHIEEAARHAHELLLLAESAARADAPDEGGPRS